MMAKDKLTLVFCTDKEADRSNFTNDLLLLGFNYSLKKVPDENFWEVSVQADGKTKNFVVELAKQNRLDYIDRIESSKEVKAMQLFLETRTLSDYTQHLRTSRAIRTYLDLCHPSSSMDTTMYAVATAHLQDGTILCYGELLLSEQQPSSKQIVEATEKLEKIKQQIENACPTVEICPGILRNTEPDYLK